MENKGIRPAFGGFWKMLQLYKIPFQQMTQNMYVQLTEKAAGTRHFIETDTNIEKTKSRAIFWQEHTLVWE